MAVMGHEHIRDQHTWFTRAAKPLPLSLTVGMAAAVEAADKSWTLWLQSVPSQVQFVRVLLATFEKYFVIDDIFDTVNDAAWRSATTVRAGNAGTLPKLVMNFCISGGLDDILGVAIGCVSRIF